MNLNANANILLTTVNWADVLEDENIKIQLGNGEALLLNDMLLLTEDNQDISQCKNGMKSLMH
jgi:hypothetical protein